MRVIYNPLHAEFKPSPKPFDSDKPNILIVGATPNKNLDRIAQALEGLNCRLTIIGKLSRDQVDLLSRYGITYDSMYDLTRDQVIDCYRAADLLLFASVYEGFGLPIIEAQAIGRPVITSNISSMPEIAGDAADFVDPYDTASIRAGVQRVLSDQNYRNQLVLDGFKNVERFNPSACAEAYASLYRELDETRSC